MSNGTLDPAAQKLAHLIFSENAYVFACIQRLSANLLRHGLLAQRGENPATPDFERVVERYYVPFCKDALREMLLFGIVTWDITTTAEGVQVPHVIPGHMLHYTYEYPKKSTTAVFKAIFTMTNQVIKRVAIWEPPDMSEHCISSAITRCSKMHTFESALLSNALAADTKIASTPLLLENTATNNGFWALRNYQPFAAQPRTFHGFDQNAAAAEHFEQNFSEPVTRVDERLMQLQESYVQKLNTIGSVESMELSKTQGAPKDDAGIPRMQLPPHTRATQASFSSTRSDLVSILSIGLRRVCAALNVPVHIFEHSGSHQSEGALRMRQCEFDEATQIYRPFLNNLLTEALRACTAADDFLLGVLTQDERFDVKPTLTIQGLSLCTSDLLEYFKLGIVDKYTVQKHLEVEYGIELAPDHGTAGAPADARGDRSGRNGTEAVGTGEE